MAKILIVEDDQILQSAYKTKLTFEGYTIETASDGEEALAKANADVPDIILLDLMMPKMSGTDFLKTFDVKNLHPNVKVIVFSNLATPDAANEVMALGAVRFLPKSSFTPNQMTALIKEILTAPVPQNNPTQPQPTS